MYPPSDGQHHSLKHLRSFSHYSLSGQAVLDKPGLSEGLTMPRAKHYDVVVIGTGFGGTMTALPIARAFKQPNKGETVLMLERGTWWTTPVGTVQDKEVRNYDFLRKNGQPVQYWSSAENFR